MTNEQSERMYAWLVSKRVRNRRYREAVMSELYIDPREKPTERYSQCLVAELLKEKR